MGVLQHKKSADAFSEELTRREKNLLDKEAELARKESEVCD